MTAADIDRMDAYPSEIFGLPNHADVRPSFGSAATGKVLRNLAGNAVSIVIPANAGSAFQQRSWSSILKSFRQGLSEPRMTCFRGELRFRPAPKRFTTAQQVIHFDGSLEPGSKWVPAFAGTTSAFVALFGSKYCEAPR